MFKFGRELQRAKVASIERHFYITGAIEYEDDYIDLIDALYQGQPNETIIIHLNTPGGRLDVTMQIINAMRTSDADVIAIADGQVASAGTLILFSAPSIGIQKFSYVMMHDGSEFAGGKVNENLRQAQFSSGLIKKICQEVYSPFFSEEEIADILDGRDLWLHSEEVEERINNLKNNITEEEEVDAEE